MVTSKGITLLLDVSYIIDTEDTTFAKNRTVASGAAATIVSDALMNPFDGWASYVLKKNAMLIFDSHQTTHASPWLPTQLDLAVSANSLQE